MKSLSHHRILRSSFRTVSTSLVGVAMLSSMVPSNAFAETAPKAEQATRGLAAAYSPSWVGKNAHANNTNFSYFSDTTTVRPEETLNDQFFDPATSKALRADYEGRIAAAQYRDNAGLTENFEEKSRFTEMKDFAKRAMNTLYKVRLKAESGKMKKVAENAPVVVREPVAAMVLAAALYTGKSMNFKIAEGLRLNSRASIRHKDAALSMSLFDTGLSTGVAYNHDTNVTAQVAQQISTEISAVLTSSAAEKGTASMVYSLSF